MASRSMRELDRVLRTIAVKDVLVCLIGESGSGKDVIARYIHDLSPRRASPFAPINCAAIPETLFESELFGHERGAFTGANQLMRGKIEAASGGSLFLDEIGELPLAMQAKFLRFLEHRRFTRVGGTKKIDADVRPICATHHPLDEEVRRGAFRADLFYRIQVITLTIPPLRDRPADVPALIEQFLSELTARHRTPAPQLNRAAMGAALFCLSALRLAGDKPTDAIHAIQGIASGVGFIGAAAVLRNAGTVRGLANAASIWIVAAIGCFAAIGDWDIAGLAALVALVANWFAVRAEKRLHTRQDGREELP